MNSFRSGSGLIGLLVTIGLLALLAAGSFYYLGPAFQNTSLENVSGMPGVTSTNIVNIGLSAQQKALQLKQQLESQSATQEQSLNSSTANDSAISTTDLQTYRNEKAGYEIQYPRDWGLLTCYEGTQLMLFAFKSFLDNCDEPHGFMSTFDIIGPVTHFNSYFGDSTNTAQVLIDGIPATRYFDEYTRGESTIRRFDVITISNFGKAFEVVIYNDENGDTSTAEKILSSFKFIE